MPKPWAPATATCCTADVSKVVGGLSQCRPSRSDFSNKVGELPSLSDASELTFAAGLIAFRLEELRGITRNFSDDFLLGEGGFGTVHKGFIGGKLRRGLKPQVVAVKLLDVHGPQGHREWLAEVMLLGQFRHPHLVKLIGYCCEAQERLLVYEFMPRGSLENHLFRRNGISLSWENRTRIAFGAAKGLAFLHGAEIPVIYRDFKTSNILLDLDYTAKLSDFGLAKTGPEGEATHVTTRVMGTHGYAAPEYIVTGHLTTKSDVYSFGVVLLELLTGRRTIDQSKPKSEKKLVEWVKPYLTSSRRLRYIMDPQLAWQYSVRGAKGVAMLALQCVSSNPKDRPQMAVVVKMLEKLQNLEDMAVDTGILSRPPIAGGRSMKVARVNADMRMKSRQIPFSGKL